VAAGKLKLFEEFKAIADRVEWVIGLRKLGETLLDRVG
jgi:hypothetical protein